MNSYQDAYPEECSRSSWHNVMASYAFDGEFDEHAHQILTSGIQEDVKMIWDVLACKFNTARCNFGLTARVIYLDISIIQYPRLLRMLTVHRGSKLGQI